MLKKLSILFGYALSILLLGDILFLTTYNAIITNWGSIIIPSLFIGGVWKAVIKEKLAGRDRLIIPGVCVLVKLTAILLRVPNLTLLAFFLISIIYFGVSFTAVVGGNALVKDM